MELQGTLFIVVGPSGVGKDTLLDGAREVLGGNAFYRFCRRIITRGGDAGGEDFRSVNASEFARLVAAGAFFHHWKAHGLHYGLPFDILDDLNRGIHVIVNGSRRELETMATLWPGTVVISVEASPEVITDRLLARGRESRAEIELRINRRAEIGDDVACAVIRVRNDDTREAGVRAVVQAIVGSAGPHFRARSGSLKTGTGRLCIISDNHPVSEFLRAQGNRVEISTRSGPAAVAELAFETDPSLPAEYCLLDPVLAERLQLDDGVLLGLRPSPSPLSREVLRRKIRGEELSPEDIELVVEDMVNDRYSHAELAGFLVSAARGMSTSEVVALARSRARRTENVRWDHPVVVDKHSMGGIPGNRVTPIVISIVTAAGLWMPKTSSRAITSASGTADAMDVMAKVDLCAADLRRVVGQTGGCIAWNGRLTHSPVDDVMNAINRPLGLKSAQLDVSSILSKKLAAGATHVLIDMPVGPEAKTCDEAEARRLKTLFVTVADALGIEARVVIADGTGPVGRGIGPALEMRDVLQVLRGMPEAPPDLRGKAIEYAATILDWVAPDPALPGRTRAIDILDSGRAAQQFDRICEAQGRRATVVPPPAALSETILAPAAMTMPGFGVRALTGIARASGAPLVANAGVDLLAGGGDDLEAGQPLLRIHAATSHALRAATARARAALEDGRIFQHSRTQLTERA